MGLTGVDDMAHLVRHRAPSGEVHTSEVADLDAAVALVERLRNDDRAEDVRVFAEVPLRFETYVKVSIAGEAADPAVEPAPPAPVVPDAPPAPAAPEATAPAAPAAPVAPPPGVLAPARIEAPSADAEELVEAVPAEGRKGLFRH